MIQVGAKQYHICGVVVAISKKQNISGLLGFNISSYNAILSQKMRQKMPDLQKEQI